MRLQYVNIQDQETPQIFTLKNHTHTQCTDARKILCLPRTVHPYKKIAHVNIFKCVTSEHLRTQQFILQSRKADSVSLLKS